MSAERIEREKTPNQKTREKLMNEPTATACRLMVIDDEAIVGKRLKQVFNKAGFTVETFTDPVAAMQAMAECAF